MTLILTTNRTYLREFTTDDALAMYTLNEDPDVIKYTGDPPFKDEATTRAFLKAYDQYQKFGMGRWAVCDKTTDEFLGWCGLKYHPNERLVEVGYRFYKHLWGQGYATETAKAAITYGFETLKLKTIYAHAHEDNIASHRVIEKCGLQYLSSGNYDGMPAKLYSVQNPLYSVTPILTKDTYSVRHPVLRQGRPIEDCQFNGDDLSTSFHLGLHFKTQLVGVVSFMKNNHELIPEEAYQLRGMAILNDFQNRGLGELLVAEGKHILKDKNITILWCNAREKALNFYKRQHFEIIGKPFVIEKIGLHYIMKTTI